MQLFSHQVTGNQPLLTVTSFYCHPGPGLMVVNRWTWIKRLKDDTRGEDEAGGWWLERACKNGKLILSFNKSFYRRRQWGGWGAPGPAPIFRFADTTAACGEVNWPDNGGLDQVSSWLIHLPDRDDMFVLLVMVLLDDLRPFYGLISSEVRPLQQECLSSRLRRAGKMP